jgi:predicted PurR-regulated permease PerM
VCTWRPTRSCTAGVWSGWCRSPGARVDGALLAFMQGPQQALYVAGLCIAIQQVEGNLLMPFVQRWAVNLPAVLGIIAAVIFGLLFGLPGVILATPLMVVLIEKLYVEAVLEVEPPTV